MNSPNPTNEAGMQSDAVYIARLGPGSTRLKFDREMLRQLRIAYNQALADGHENFVFHERDLVTDYARYLIEYVDGRLT